MERASALLYQALAEADAARQGPLRRTLVDLLLKQQRFYEAETAARKLVAASNGEPEADEFANHRLLALAIHGRYRQGDLAAADVAEASVTLIAAIRHALTLKIDPELVEILASLLVSDDARLVICPPGPASSDPSSDDAPPVRMTTTARRAEADQWMNRMVERSPEDPMAWLVRSNFRRTHGDESGAGADLNEALRVGGDNVEVRLFAAGQARLAAARLLSDPDPAAPPPANNTQDPTDDNPARRQLETAAEHYRHVLDQLEPKNDMAVLGLGRVTTLLGQPEAAIDLWRPRWTTTRSTVFRSGSI